MHSPPPSYVPSPFQIVVEAHSTPSPFMGNIQCDQIKIAKCLYKLPKNDFTRKMNDFATFTKNSQTSIQENMLG